MNGPQPGLCALCLHSKVVPTARGSTFWLCERAAVDPRYRKYPALPVLACPGFEPHPAGHPPSTP